MIVVVIISNWLIQDCYKCCVAKGDFPQIILHCYMIYKEIIIAWLIVFAIDSSMNTQGTILYWPLL